MAAFTSLPRPLHLVVKLRNDRPDKASVIMPLVFSYGTLQQEDVQLATFGRLLHGQKE